VLYYIRRTSHHFGVLYHSGHLDVYVPFPSSPL
jgi:hypothetical protein